ncbi:hypothetical protein ACFLZ5_05595 [Thermodesulfobacteriota bacterium]
MDKREYYRQDGYQKGLDDAKRTEGKIKQETIDKYLNNETEKLSSTFTRAFIEGWYAGFNDAVRESELKSIRKDVFWKNHIYWENPIYKNI